MALRLPRFQSGRPILEEVTSEKLNQIVDAIRQCEVQSGVGYDVTRGPGGATLSIRRDNVIPASQQGAAYIVGPPSTGINDEGQVIGVAQPVPSWSVKRPGSSSFEPVYVYGPNNYLYEFQATGCSSVEPVYAGFANGLVLSSSDKSRFCGLLAPYQRGSFAYDQTQSCACNPFIGDPCTQIVDYCGNSWTLSIYTLPGAFFSQLGSFGILTSVCGVPFGQTGIFTFRCTFDLGSLSPSQVKLRFRLQTGIPQSSDTTISTIQLNSQTVEYAPLGTFSTSAGFNEIREITNGFVQGVNHLDFLAEQHDPNYYPGIKCQFEPTTAVIVSKNSSGEVSNFSSLTEAQLDLIGLGTLVRAVSGGTAYDWTYTGIGNKRSSSSYNRLREA